MIRIIWFIVMMWSSLSYSEDNPCSLKEELLTLATTAYHEARGEGISGMKAVMEVVLHRVKNPNFPNSICEVVYQPSSNTNRPTACAFSFTCDKAIELATKDEEEFRKALVVALNMMYSDDNKTLTYGADHYLDCDIRYTVGWVKKMRFVTRVGNHCFYKEGKRV